MAGSKWVDLNDHKSIAEMIASIYDGMGQQILALYESRYPSPHYDNKPKPERNAEIARRYQAGGISQRKLAEEYGICAERVGQIIRKAGR